MSEQNSWVALHASSAKPDAEQHSAIFVVVIVGMLLVGVAGVFLFGPSKAVEAVRGIITGHKKSASAENTPPESLPPQTSVRTKRRTKEPVKTVTVEVKKAVTPSDWVALTVPVEPAPRPRSG